jgi:hypothetical protein
MFVVRGFFLKQQNALDADDVARHTAPFRRLPE